MAFQTWWKLFQIFWNFSCSFLLYKLPHPVFGAFQMKNKFWKSLKDGLRSCYRTPVPENNQIQWQYVIFENFTIVFTFLVSTVGYKVNFWLKISKPRKNTAILFFNILDFLVQTVQHVIRYSFLDLPNKGQILKKFGSWIKKLLQDASSWNQLNSGQ